ncbi:type II toxin-antitoxin system RelE/ParE family toxin [Aquibacillus sp. 3ASR75-11]|uniref:Type II toxin-antitoxin system RelE/ParE family toxin n=1 Tax=Terrihalobacillus insolitus TaxID=2950438 RepID=A0A9X4AN99_9BACI|nr:type II toxin-antitoxin system RelE/ParE family toxin [Terrihalobacillus insolitus]MDC3426292.1 type II toxin-antitoxin system RelE/ParE family toxin [Terrihalobacillus insolitus]
MKFVEKQDKNTQKRLRSAILEIQEKPYTTSNTKALKNKDLARKRVRNIRIVYKVFDDELYIYVVRIDNRGQVYKNI